MTKTIKYALIALAVFLGLWLGSVILGNALDNAYMRKCNAWHNCDYEAIHQYQLRGCEIVGDVNGNKWAECSLDNK